MTTMTFDALGYFEQLKDAGFTEGQAKVQANAFREYAAWQEENTRRELATKMDLLHMEMRLRSELTEKMESNKHEILKWLIGLLVAQTAALVAAVTYVK